MKDGWVTNNQEAPKALRAADRLFVRRMNATFSMILADKIVASREAKAERDATYQRIAASA